MKKNAKSGFFPIFINLNKFPCLIVGGGKVAYRKVLSLQNFNADITVISPKICKQLNELAKVNKIRIINKSYSKEHIKYFKIVICATNNEKTNQTVYNDCVKEGILINVVDAPALCDFIMPANVKRGDLTIAISSQGKAPFYVKEMKKKLEAIISPKYSEIIQLASQFRNHLLSIGNAKSAQTKAKMFRKFSSINWENILTEKGNKNSYKEVEKILNELD